MTASKPDHEDSWMDPPKQTAWKHEDPMKKPFLIERERRIQGPLTTWDTWDSFASSKERDKALAALQKDYPAWHLRSAYYQPLRAIL